MTLLTASELADQLKVGKDAVYRWAAAGVIPSYRLPGGGLRFDAERVLSALEKEPAA